MNGLLLMLLGFFKKLVIADNVAVTANKGIHPARSFLPDPVTGVLAFTVQIYADFSRVHRHRAGCRRVVRIQSGAE